MAAALENAKADIEKANKIDCEKAAKPEANVAAPLQVFCRIHTLMPFDHTKIGGNGIQFLGAFFISCCIPGSSRALILPVEHRHRVWRIALYTYSFFMHTERQCLAARIEIVTLLTISSIPFSRQHLVALINNSRRFVCRHASSLEAPSCATPSPACGILRKSTTPSDSSRCACWCSNSRSSSMLV